MQKNKSRYSMIEVCMVWPARHLHLLIPIVWYEKKRGHLVKLKGNTLQLDKRKSIQTSVITQGTCCHGILLRQVIQYVSSDSSGQQYEIRIVPAITLTRIKVIGVFSFHASGYKLNSRSNQKENDIAHLIGTLLWDRIPFTEACVLQQTRTKWTIVLLQYGTSRVHENCIPVCAAPKTFSTSIFRRLLL